MSFYEGGYVPHKKCDDYLDQIIVLTRRLPSKHKQHVQTFAKNTRVPLNVIKLVVNHSSGDASTNEWDSSPTRPLCCNPGFVVKSMDDAFKFIQALDREVNGLKMTDIKALTYSILSFNDNARHAVKLSADVKAFSQTNSRLYAIELSFKFEGTEYNISVLCSLFYTGIGQLSKTDDRLESLNTYWFPKFDAYFADKTRVTDGMTISIEEFIKECRRKIS